MKRKPIDLLNEIRMRRVTYPKHAALLVEGRADCAYLRKVTCPNQCFLNVGPGKTLARQAAKLATKIGVPGVVALLDRDHDHLLEKQSIAPNIIYTDANDLETTIIRSPAFECFLHEYLDYDARANVLSQSKRTSVADFLLDIAGVIGAFRFLSLRHVWNLRFRDLRIEMIFDLDSMEVSAPKLVDHVFHSTEDALIEQIEALSLFEEFLESVEDVREYATGHDTTSLLAFLLSSQVWFKAELNVDHHQIERELRQSFSGEHFRSSSMYGFLVDWEQANQPFAVFPVNSV